MMVYLPLSERMGWWPSAERSMMARRRKPSARPLAASAMTPPESGPRCTRVSAIACTCVRSEHSSNPGACQNPVMPHMSGDQTGLAGDLVVHGLGRIYLSLHSKHFPHMAHRPCTHGGTPVRIASKLDHRRGQLPRG